MKNTFFIIFVVAAFLFAFFALMWRRNKYGTAVISELPKEISSETQTVVVDPTDDKEIIVSDFGEDNVSDSDAIQIMENRLTTLSNKINDKLGEFPSSLVFRVYNKMGKLVDSNLFDPKLKTT